MTLMRMSEAAINHSLDACLLAAKAGDAQQARRLHDMLDSMLIEREEPEGRMWLTEHGRMLLAEMHRRLSHCDGSGEHLHTTVMEAVQLKPHPEHWADNCSFVRDLRVAIAVANELCEQRSDGEQPDLDGAISRVAARGEFDLSEPRIRAVYDEISSEVPGFRSISHC